MIRISIIALCLTVPLLANVWPSFGPGHAQYAAGVATSISPSFTARKIQGSTCLAPCAVHFDAIGMGALSATPYVTTETTDSVFDREFHSLHFEWDFDDPNSGTWSTGAAAATATPQSRNYDIGGIAGHVYENPGTYTVTLTVTNPAGESAQTTRQVVVGDRTTYFTEANTFCFANNPGTFQGCPLDTNSDGACDGADADNCTVTNDTYLALHSGDGCTGGTEDCANADAQMRRVLFKRGDTFLYGSNFVNLARDIGTPGFIEAFGSGAKPILDRGASEFFLGDNWTLVDLHMRNCGLSCWLLGRRAGGQADDNTSVIRVDATDVHRSCFEGSTDSPFTESWSRWGRLHAMIDVNCTASATRVNFFSWPGAKYYLHMGGTMDPASIAAASTSMRVHHLSHAVIAHTNWINPTPTREHWHFRVFDVVSGIDYREGSDTRYILASDNALEESASNISYAVRVCVDAGCNCGEPSGCGGQNPDGTIVDTHDLIFERNFHYWPQDSAATKNAIYELQGGGMTIRNNVYDLQGGFTGAFQLVQVTGEPTAKLAGSTTTGNVHVYNNTLYFTDAISANFTLGAERETGTGCGDPTPVACYSRSNLVVAPNFTGVLAWDAAFTHSDDLKVTTPNPFVATVPARGTTTIDDFALAISSAPIGAGYDFTPGTDTDRWVYDDAMRLCRPGNADGWDVGAHEYGASACQ